MNGREYDIIIIGGGPAGLTAGMYASRSRLKTLLIEKMGCGGQSIITDWIENYPGFPEGTSGFELAAKIEEQAKRFGLEVQIADVSGVTHETDVQRVATSEGEYRAPAVIIASGASYKSLDVPGEFEFRGKGVSYCATCDGPFFRDKDILVVGGGNSAVQEAIYLTRFARSVTLVHRRDRLRASPVLQERAAANDKIRIRYSTVVTRISGGEQVSGVELKNVASGESSELPVQGVFIFVGHMPNSSFLSGLVAMDESGFVVTNDDMATSVSGIFACGDVRKKLLRQVVTACGEGATAAFAAQDYVENMRGTAYK